MTPHLTHQQLCDLLLDTPTLQSEPPTAAAHASQSHVSEAQDHLRDCYACSAELATLTASLTGYHDTAHAVAQRDFTALPRTAPTPLLGQRSLLHPIYWAIAATALVIAILPFTAPRRAPLVQPQPSAVVTPATATATATAESDATLLEDINQDISTSIPPSMQPLVDPTASSSSNIDSTTQRTN